MTVSRRTFLSAAVRCGLASSSTGLWLSQVSEHAFAQVASTYKAIVVVTMIGGNDANNLLIPIDQNSYNEYSSIRPQLALSINSALPLASLTGGANYGFHPSLVNIAGLYNGQKALVVANVGPIASPVTKAMLYANTNLAPQALLSHPAGTSQWESATTLEFPSTGWGGRLADLLVSRSGLLPPVLDAGPSSIFTVGRSVQGIAVQSNSPTMTVLPDGIADAIMAIAQGDSKSQNLLIAQAAQLRIQALNQQALIAQAQVAGNLKTQFPANLRPLPLPQTELQVQLGSACLLQSWSSQVFV